MINIIPFLLLFIASSLNAVVNINHVDINDIASPGQVLIFDNENSDNIAFFFEKDNLSIGSMPLSDQISKLSKDYNNLYKYKNKLSQWISKKSLSLRSGNNSSHHGAYLNAEEEIFLQACNKLKIILSILESKEIFLFGNQIELKSCYFTNANTLQIEANSETALFKMIKFTFADQEFCLAQGNINLETGEMNDNFIVMGANKVEIYLNPRAFE